MSALAEPDVLRAVLSGLRTRLDGKPYATSVANRRRMILRNAVGYAIERKLLTTNPLPVVKGRPVDPAAQSLVVDPKFSADLTQ